MAWLNKDWKGFDELVGILASVDLADVVLVNMKLSRRTDGYEQLKAWQTKHEHSDQWFDELMEWIATEDVSGALAPYLLGAA